MHRLETLLGRQLTMLLLPDGSTELESQNLHLQGMGHL
jgi:hypothetical protein